MNETLERRYRWLLRLYPRAFRRDHEDEMLAVLLSSAGATQTRPHLKDLFNLVIHGLLWRVRHLSVPPAWEHRHAAVMLPIRVLCGVVLLLLVAVLYGYDRAGWWTPVLVPAAIANFYVAGRLGRPLANP